MSVTACPIESSSLELPSYRLWARHEAHIRRKGNAYRNWCENLKERNDFEYLTVWRYNIKTRFK